MYFTVLTRTDSMAGNIKSSNSTLHREGLGLHRYRLSGGAVDRHCVGFHAGMHSVQNEELQYQSL